MRDFQRECCSEDSEAVYRSAHENDSSNLLSGLVGSGNDDFTGSSADSSNIGSPQKSFSLNKNIDNYKNMICGKK